MFGVIMESDNNAGRGTRELPYIYILRIILDFSIKNTGNYLPMILLIRYLYRFHILLL